MKFARTALACALALLVVACATTPAPAEQERAIDPTQALASLRLCETTYAQLRAQLGVPTRDGLLHRQRLITWITAWDPLPRYLGVLLNEQAVVVDMYWDIPSEVPWQPVDQCR